MIQTTAIENANKIFKNLLKEFNTPLERIILPLELLIAEDNQTSKAQELRVVYANALKFNSLFYQFSKILSISSNKEVIKLEHIDIIQVLQSIMDKVQALAKSRKVNISLHSSAAPIEAYWDVNIIYHTLGIVLGNAIKYSKSKGGTVEVVVEVIENKRVRISVKDEGIGIAPKKLPHVFNPFYDEDEIHLKLYQSTSIGLYLVKSYLQLIHGEISVQSIKQRGSTFILELPIYANPYNIPFEAFELLKKNTNLLELAQQRIYEFETSEVLDADIYDDVENELFLIFSECKEDKLLLEPLITGKLKKMFVSDKSHCSMRAINHVPDCIIYFITEDYNSDFEIIRFLKRNKITSHIPIVVIIPNEQNTQIKLLAKSNYVHDCIAKNEVEVLLNKSIENIFYNKKLQYEFVSTQNKSQASSESDIGYDMAFIQKINLLIEENLESEELNSDFFVSNMFQSRTQIHRKLKALTNLSLSRYVRVHKLKLAKYFLETKQGNVSEAAYKFGFNSVSYFSKSYKEEYGYSPSEAFE